MSDPLLAIKNVSVDLTTPRGNLRAVDGVDLALDSGRTLAIIGESGAGKTLLSRAVLQLLPRNARLSGKVIFDRHSLTELTARELQRLRGRSLAMIFQDTANSLNPVLTIGQQIIETLREHLGMDHPAATRRAAELIEMVGISEPRYRLRQYSHQLSSGMRQRVAIAIAVSCEPKLLIADEPTSALDAMMQAQILDLLISEQRRRRMTMILNTHDLGIVASRTDEVAVMYAGQIVERAPTPILFRKMRMPYTQALLATIVTINARSHVRLPTIPSRAPDPMCRPAGCLFAPRCALADARCRTEQPPLSLADAAGQQYACWHPLPPQQPHAL